MKNKLVFSGLLIAVLAIGIVMAGCDTGTGGGGSSISVDGTTWTKSPNFVLSFNGNNFTLKESNSTVLSGTYTFSGGNSGKFSMTTGSNSGTADYTLSDTTLIITNSSWTSTWAKMVGTYTKD
jgi:hypothetical protein